MKKICDHEGFEIYFEAEEEISSMRDHFINECDWTEKQFKNLKDTNPAWFSARVVAKKEGVILGEDYLGCCCYKSEEEFYTKYFDDYFKDMIKACVSEAEKNLPERIKELEAQRDGLDKIITALKEQC